MQIILQGSSVQKEFDSQCRSYRIWVRKPTSVNLIIPFQRKIQIRYYRFVVIQQIQTMDSPVFNSSAKNRQPRSENPWSMPSNYPFHQRAQPRAAHDTSNQFAFQYAYLVIEKNLKLLSHTCNKLIMKQKRKTFRRLAECYRHVPNKNQQLSLRNSVNVKPRKDVGRLQPNPNPEHSPKQLLLVCLKSVSLKLQKLQWVVNKKRVQSLLSAFYSISAVGSLPSSDQLPLSSIAPTRGLQTSEIDVSGRLVNPNGSRLSSKHKSSKVVKGREMQQLKQNSHYNGVDLAMQNERLESELTHEENEREKFAVKMFDMLEYYEKQLSSGSTTSRTKKNK